jgi:hypothetical protein
MEAKGVNVSEFYNTIKYKDQIQSYFEEHPNYKDETESQIMGEWISKWTNWLISFKR